jgi:hypothetical protein
MSGRYILNDDGDPVEEPDLLKWAAWLEEAGSLRHTHCDEVGDVTVSTIFLGLDYSSGPNAPPLLFETMVLAGEHDHHMERCSTKEQAKEQHDEVVQMVREGQEGGSSERTR